MIYDSLESLCPFLLLSKVAEKKLLINFLIFSLNVHVLITITTWLPFFSSKMDSFFITTWHVHQKLANDLQVSKYNQLIYGHEGFLNQLTGKP